MLRSKIQAKNIAFAIANSPLVKTAIAGEDANWGRISDGNRKDTRKNKIKKKFQIKFGNNILGNKW